MKQHKIEFGKRPKNPLRRRVWKDLRRDVRRYLMIFAMLVVTIGFVSGMYVANNSMMQTIDNNAEKLLLEDGHFTLSSTADSALKKAVSTGEKADMVGIFRERAYDEAEKKISEASREALEKKVAEQVETAIRSAAENAVKARLAQAGTALPDDALKKAVEDAADQAMKENYDKAYKDALNTALESDEYKKAQSDALKDAKKEIDEKIEEEYADLDERYDLSDESFTPCAVTLYDLFYKDKDEISNGEKTGRVRVYSERTDIDLYDILSGRAPENEREIAIDRMHADNAGIVLGDKMTVGNAEFEVVGLAAFVDYSTLYENNTDTMFDALTFNVAMTTPDGFSRISGAVNYCYAFRYENSPADLYEEKTFSDNFLKALITQTAVSQDEIKIEDYVPSYANHAITFAPDDMGSDKAMGGVLLYILTAVLAFIFAVTISSTLDRESEVIGTLRASGFTKGELLRYYMTLPMAVVFAAAAVGNILGYTVFKYVVTAMYYNSYSLPSYETIWTPDAFVRTTVVPIVLMFVINIIIIVKTLKLSPLQFLRHDLKKVRRRKAIRLPKWGFFKRFRMRVFLQNVPNYLMLFIGVVFVMLLLSMAVGMPATLAYYQEEMPNMIFAQDQVILRTSEDDDGEVITTSAEGAERFSLTSLERKAEDTSEEVTVYGVSADSRYVLLDSGYTEQKPSDDGNENQSVYISAAFADKFGVKAGDTITLSEKYEDKDYTWTVYGVHDYSASVAVFMTNDRFNEAFDREEGSFDGYMSDDEISDIDDKYVAKEITAEDMTKLAKQLDHSMGSYMVYFQYVCVIVAAIIMYLLTKIIIEKNEGSISMVKILGYTDGEIASLYLITTGIVVFISEFAAMYLGYKVMGIFWRSMMMSLGGWFDFKMTPDGFIKEFVLVFAAYLIIAVFDFIRIRKVPKVLALKNAE